jgi:hypothetical protein
MRSAASIVCAVMGLCLAQSQAWADDCSCNGDTGHRFLHFCHKKNDCAPPCDCTASSCCSAPDCCSAPACCPEPCKVPHCHACHQWFHLCHKSTGNCEEDKLNRFWHDYYGSMANFYCGLSKANWVTYYKNHGQPMEFGGADGGDYGYGTRVQYAPVFMTPAGAQWMVPTAAMGYGQ